MKRIKIGEFLQEAGLITGEQLENALTVQHGRKKRLGKVLVELGYVTESQIVEALAALMSLPWVDGNNLSVDKETLALIPKQTAESKVVFPVERRGKQLLVAMADPLDWLTIDEISFRTGLTVRPAVAAESTILELLERHYGSAARIYDLLNELPIAGPLEIVPEVSLEDVLDAKGDDELAVAPPIVKLVTLVVTEAVQSRASDIHIDPREKEVHVRYRIDGELRLFMKFPRHILEPVVSRIKIISSLDITNRRTPQDGRCTVRLEAKRIDLRISTLPTVHGEKAVIRLLDHETGMIPLSRLGVQERVLQPLLEVANQPQGMLIITGPTGSGKTTTLYALLQQLRSDTQNLITIEDPVEYRLCGITQVGINESAGLTFSSALRSALRQDPDVIMVGEIRDRETAEIAARASLTGHLVLSTLHTNDTISSISRLIDIGLEPYLVTAALSGILAQRLVRANCTNCAVEVPLLQLEQQGLPPLSRLVRGAGCKNCQFTGYYGRIGVYEFLQFTPEIRRLIAQRGGEEELWGAAQRAGMVSLFRDAWEKVAAGLTTPEEVLSNIFRNSFDHPPQGAAGSFGSPLASVPGFLGAGM